jgi:hypothetical protein
MQQARAVPCAPVPSRKAQPITRRDEPGEGGGPGHQTRSTMSLEELVSEFEGLDSQLPNQLIPSRSGRTCCGHHSQATARTAGGTASGPAGQGGSPRGDLGGRSRFRISCGWVSLKARNSELACRACSCQRNGKSRLGGLI